MKVAIITEGNRNTGYGHLTRCLSIYQAFEEKGITPVYIANCDETAKKFISNVNMTQLNWIMNIDKLIGMIKGNEIAIVDSYLAEIEIYHKIYNAVKKVVYIDDYLRLDYPPGIILNGTIDAENLPYKKDINHNYFLGVNFVPLRKEFWDVDVNDIQVVKNSILMVFGGQDIRNLTELILNFLIKEFPDYHIDVVLGNHRKKIKINNRNIEFRHNTTADEMLNLMKKNEIAITAGGQTLYELARLKKKTIAVGVIENQKYNLKGWFNNKFINEVIWYDDRELLMKIKNQLIFKTNNFNIGTIIDGQGARRIVNHCYQ